MVNPKKTGAAAATAPDASEYVPTDILASVRALIGADPADFHPDGTPAFQEASRALDRIESKHGLRVADRLKLREQLSFEMMLRLSEPELPKKAPELWSDRIGRKENPVAFIRRVYAPWVGRGLQRSHLHSLDLPLYTALAVWLHRHPEIDFPELSSP